MEKIKGKTVLKLVMTLSGALATQWFLIREILKPSGASFPCQHTAFLSSGLFNSITIIGLHTFKASVSLVVVLIVLNFTSCKNKPKPTIEVWYGEQQHFGKLGNAHPYINILGNVRSEAGIRECRYSLNNGVYQTFPIGSDLHRLANHGDFNIEFRRELLVKGRNEVSIEVIDSSEKTAAKTVILEYTDHNTWPLPFEIRWDTVKNIQDVVQVCDGRWEITEEGLRVMEPYYDRVVAFGDNYWENYEITAEVIFHSYVKPRKGREAPFFSVTHAAIASRWIGYSHDEHNPHRKWYPIGATCEFRLSPELDSCSFRILGGARKGEYSPKLVHTILLNKKYILKTSTATLDSISTVYKAKLWPADREENDTWDIIYTKSPEDVKSGCALLIAHHTVVTFGSIKAIPIGE
jgi:hypothetical protein